MVSLHSIFPCLRHVKTSRERLQDRQVIAETNEIVKKKAELHVAAMEFEAMVKEFLNDRDRVEAARHE